MKKQACILNVDSGDDVIARYVFIHTIDVVDDYDAGRYDTETRDMCRE